MNEGHKAKSCGLSPLVKWLIEMAIMFLAVVGIMRFVLINAHIPSASMENTIMTDSYVIGFRLYYEFTKPKTGDIIIFRFPDDEKQFFVKRVIGVPGDTIEIRDHKLFINGAETHENYLKEEPEYYEDMPLVTVPEDSYFCMGDNRNQSFDSRYWEHHFVTDQEIVAKALFII